MQTRTQSWTWLYTYECRRLTIQTGKISKVKMERTVKRQIKCNNIHVHDIYRYNRHKNPNVIQNVLKRNPLLYKFESTGRQSSDKETSFLDQLMFAAIKVKTYRLSRS